MLRSLFVKIFQQNMSLNQRNLTGVPIDLKLNNLDLNGNTTEFKTLPTRPRSHRYILFYTGCIKKMVIELWSALASSLYNLQKSFFHSRKDQAFSFGMSPFL